MPKNVVFLHLESISNTILWNYRSELETVWRLMQDSLRFTRFNSNATSTQMVGVYFGTGSTAIYDNSAFYQQDPTPEIRFTYLRTRFENAGYVWRDVTLDLFTRWEGVYGSWHHYNTFQSFCTGINSFITDSVASGTPFVLYHKNMVSHMALDDQKKATAVSFSDRFVQGYKSLDASVNQLLAILAQANCWDNTLIVVFGDHGDEMWSHGLNRGYCHGIPPYASLTSTPLFMYNSGKPAGDDDRLIQTIDLGKTVFELLMPDYNFPANIPAFDQTPLGGKDVFSESSELIFSQNLYALQLEHCDPEEGLYKGYSVTDGVYRLVASSGGNRPKEGGLEFFCDRIDPTNNRNLLDFFVLSFDGEPINFRAPPEAIATDFPLVFNQDAVKDLMTRFSHLRRELHSYVRTKEKFALERGASRYHVMPEKVFTTARKRIRSN